MIVKFKRGYSKGEPSKDFSFFCFEFDTISNCLLVVLSWGVGVWLTFKALVFFTADVSFQESFQFAGWGWVCEFVGFCFGFVMIKIILIHWKEREVFEKIFKESRIILQKQNTGIESFLDEWEMMGDAGEDNDGWICPFFFEHGIEKPTGIRESAQAKASRICKARWMKEKSEQELKRLEAEKAIEAKNQKDLADKEKREQEAEATRIRFEKEKADADAEARATIKRLEDEDRAAALRNEKRKKEIAELKALKEELLKAGSSS